MGTNILNLTGAQLEFTGGNLGAGFTNLVTVAANNKVSNVSSNLLTMSLVPGNGTFKGKVTNPDNGVAATFSGAVLPKLGAGYGFLLGTNQCSRVVLAP